MIAVVVDLVILYRRGKIIAQNTQELHQQHVNDLIQRFEVERVQSVIDAQIKERKLIGRDVHDRLGGVLFVLRLQLQQMRSKIQDLGVENDVQLEEFANLLDEGVTQVRNLSNSLKANPNHQFNYADAVDDLVKILRKANSLDVELEIESLRESERKPYEVELYAITQEFIRHTLKFGKATKVKIQITCSDKQCTFMYSDNGTGYQPNQSYDLNVQDLNQRLVTFDSVVDLRHVPFEGFNCRIEFGS
ncbi:MAG: hypothetical protein KDC76_01445 [Bacteroidetes bacterium]|nr:hypothetical protein [Bacteroidota bacterium]